MLETQALDTFYANKFDQTPPLPPPGKGLLQYFSPWWSAEWLTRNALSTLQFQQDHVDPRQAPMPLCRQEHRVQRKHAAFFQSCGCLEF